MACRKDLSGFQMVSSVRIDERHTPDAEVCRDFASSQPLKNAVNSEDALLQEANCDRPILGRQGHELRKLASFL